MKVVMHSASRTLSVVVTGAMLVGLLGDVNQAAAQQRPANNRQNKPSLVIQLKQSTAGERTGKANRPVLQRIGKSSPRFTIDGNNTVRNRILEAIKQNPRVQAARQRFRISGIDLDGSMTGSTSGQVQDTADGTCNSGGGDGTTTNGDNATQTEEETMPTDNGSNGTGTCPTGQTDAHDELPTEDTGMDPGDGNDEAGQVDEEDASTPTDGTDEGTEEQPLSIVTGSELSLDGQSLGRTKGTVRLRVMGIGLPVSVLGWTDTKAKIRLPKLDLTQPTKANLEVVRADGVMISRSPITLTPSGARLAIRQ